MASSSIGLRTRARISAHVIWDHIVQPVAQSAADVPWSVHGISPEWLTATLCHGTPGAQVADYRISGGHDGSSVRRQITVTYNDAGRRAGLPENLYTKSTPTILTRISSGMAARAEGNFYREIRPQLAIEAPELYHSGHDPVSGRSIHVFDDLAIRKGATFCNHLTALSDDQAGEIVDTLAVFHGRFFDSARFGQDLTWLPRHETFLLQGERIGTREGHDRAMLEARDVIPGAVFERRDETWPMMIRGFEVHQQEPRTLLHSDVHIGNWYITGAGHMGLGDWALVCIGHWARDFAYAVSTSLVPEQRRSLERDLLARYLARLKAEGGPDVDPDTGWLRYRQQLFAALLMWTPTLCPPPTMPDMQPREMSREMIRRITAAIADLDALDSQEES